MKFPLFQSFKATSYIKAFVLNSVLAGIITALAIELRLALEDETSNYYKFWTRIYHVHKLQTSHKLIATFFITFIVGMIAYHIFFYLFLYGGGQLNLVKNHYANYNTLMMERV